MESANKAFVKAALNGNLGKLQRDVTIFSFSDETILKAIEKAVISGRAEIVLFLVKYLCTKKGKDFEKELANFKKNNSSNSFVDFANFVVS